MFRKPRHFSLLIIREVSYPCSQEQPLGTDLSVIQPTYSYPISTVELEYIFNLLLGLPSNPFPSVFPKKRLPISLVSSLCASCTAARKTPGISHASDEMHKFPISLVLILEESIQFLSELIYLSLKSPPVSVTARSKS